MNNVKASTALGLVLAAAIQVAPWAIEARASAETTVPPVQSPNRATVIDVTPGGTPIVNIATPRADGTSYNVFERLNAGKEGLVFNNSPAIGVSTIGGQILPNANLVRNGRSASLILNEVLGGNRSTLAGTVEIFGPRAALVIANPSGITCNGCGFINISRVALSSGRITFANDGTFAGFQVDGGDVTVTGSGLFAGNVDYFDIVTEAARINASLYARDLVIAGGRSEYDYATRQASGRAGGNERLAIDSNLLGGMYANRIRLIGTGAGVGVNLDGTIAALEGPIEIEADGRIGISSLASAADLTLKSRSGDIAATGQVYSGGSATLDAGGSINYSGPLLGALKNVGLNGGHSITLSGKGGLYAGLDNTGRIGSNGSIQLSAASRVSVDASQIIAPDRIGIAAGSAALGKDSLISSADVAIGSFGAFDAAGTIAGQRTVSLSANRLSLSGAVTANGNLELLASDAALDGSLLGLDGLRVDVHAGLSIGSTGLLQSNGIVDIGGGGISSAGRIVGIQGITVGAAGTVTSVGTLLSGAGLSLTAGKDLDLSGVLAANRSVDLAAAGQARIDAKVAAAGDLSVSAGGADIVGSLSTNGTLALHTSNNVAIGRGAALVADGLLSISGTNLDLAGSIDAGGDVTLALPSRLFVRDSGSVRSGSALRLGLGELDNAGLLSATGPADILTRGETENRGRIVTSGDANVSAGLGFTQTGSLEVGKALTLSAGGSALLGGKLLAGGRLHLGAAATDISGTVVSNGPLELATSGDLTLSSAAIVYGKGGADLHAGHIFTSDGQVYADHDLLISATASLFNGGAIEALKKVQLQASDIVLGGTVLGASISSSSSGSLEIDGTVNSAGGFDILSGRNTTITGLAHADGHFGLTSIGTLNVSGALSAIENGELSAGAISITRGGSALAYGDLQISAGIDFSNEGTLAADGTLSLTYGRTFSNLGLVSSGADYAVSAAGDYHAEGSIRAGGQIRIAARDISLTGNIGGIGGLWLTGRNISLGAASDIESGNLLSINAAGNLEAGGRLLSLGDLSLQAGAELYTTGTIGTNGSAQLVSDGKLVNSGLVESAGPLSLTADTLRLGGQLASASSIRLLGHSADVAGSITSISGLDFAIGGVLSTSASSTLASNGIIDLTGRDLVLHGAIAGNAAIDLAANGDLAHYGRIDALGAVSIQVNRTFANKGRIVTQDLISLNSGAAQIAGSLVSGARTSVKSEALEIAGEISAGGALSLSGTGAVSTGASSHLLSGDHLDIAAGGPLAIGGTVGSVQQLNLVSGNSVVVSGSVRSDGSAAVTGRDIEVSGDVLVAGSAALQAVDGFDAIGRIAALGNLEITAARVRTLSGSQLAANQSLALSSYSDLVHDGMVSSADAVNLSGVRVLISGATVSGGNLSITGESIALTSHAILAVGGVTSLSSSGALQTSADISSNGDFLASASDDLIQAGTIRSAGALRIIGGSITGAGSILANGLVQVRSNSGSIDLAGPVSSNGGVSLSALRDLSLAGSLSTAGPVSVAADNFTHSGSILSGGVTRIELSGAFRNAGMIVSDLSVDISAATFDLAGNGAIRSGLSQHIAVAGTAQVMGTIASVGDVSLEAASFGIGGSLMANGSINVSSRSGPLDIGAAALLSSQAGLDLSSASELTNRGVIQSGRAVSLAAAGHLSTTGELDSLDRVSISGQAIDLDGRVLANGALSAAASGILTVQGAVSAQASLELAADALGLHSGSRLLSDGAIDLRGVSIDASGLIGAGGPLVIAGTGAVALTGTTMSNANASVSGSSVAQGGSLFAGGSLALSGSDAVTNLGSIEALQSIGVAGQNISTTGRIVSEGSLSLSSLGGEAVFGGSISAKGRVSLLSRDNAAIGGTVASGDALVVDIARDLSLTGSVSAASTIALTTGQALQGSGSILSGKDLSFNAGQIDFSGRAEAVASVSLTAATGPVRITGAIEGNGITLLSSAGSVDLGGSARLVSIGALDVAARNDLTIGALLASNGRLTLNSGAGNIDIATGAGVQAGGMITAAAGLAFDNTATLVSNGSISLAAASVKSGSVLSNSDIAISSTGALSITGPVNGAGDVSLQSRVASIEIKTGAAVASGGALHLDAATDIFNSGRLSSELRLDALAGDGISATGDIVARAGALNLDARRLDLDGLAYGEGQVSLHATEISIGGTIGGNAGLTLAGNRLFVLDHALLQANQALSANVDEIQLDGTLRALGDATLAGNKVEIASSGVLEAGSSLSLNFAGRLGNAGRASANGKLQIAAGQFTSSGVLSATSDVALSTSAAAIDGLIEAGGALRVSGADLSLATTGNLRATGAIALDGGTHVASGLIEAGGPIGLSATGTLFIPGILRSNTDIILSGSAGVDIAGSAGAGGSISVVASNISLSGAAGANGALSLTAGSGGLTISGNLEAGGGVALKATGGELGISSSGRIAGGTLNADAVSITNNGTLLSAGTITLTAGTFIDNNGALGSNNLVAAIAGSKLSVGSAATIGAGSIAFDGRDLDIIGSLSSSGDIDLTARNSVRLPGTVSALGSLRLGGTAGSAADVLILAGGQLYAQSGIAIAQVRDVSVAGLVSAGGPAADASIAYQGTLNVSGRIESGHDAILEYQGGTNGTTATTDISGQLVAGHDIDISGGSLLLSGLANALHDFNFATNTYRFDATGVPVSLELAGVVHADQDISISVPGGLTIGSGARFSAGQDLRLAAGFTNNSGQIDAGGALTVASRPNPAAGALPAADIANQGVIQSGGPLSLTAHNALELGAGSLVLSNMSVRLSASTINAAGTIAGGDLVSLASNGDIAVGGLIQSGRRIEIASSANIAISQGAQIETLGNAQTIGSERDQYISANLGISAGGSLTNAGNLYSTGSIALKSEASSISNVGGGKITALGTAVLQADRGAILTQGGATGLSAGSLALFQGQDFNNRGGFTGAGNLLISAPNINNTGGLLGAGGSLSLVASGNITNSDGGTFFAGGDLSIDGATFTNDLSTVLAQGDVSINAESVLNASARIESLGGDVRISTGQLDNRIKMLVIQHAGSPSPGPFDIPPVDIPPTYAPGGVFFGLLLSQNEPIPGDGGGGGAGGGGGPSDDIVLANTGASLIAAARDITINASGAVTNSNSSILAGRNIAITADTLNNLADLVRTTHIEDVVEQQIVHFVEDAPVQCPPQAIPGTCRQTPGGPGIIPFTYWDEYQDVVVGQQTVVENVPLPTIIRAGGTLSITANQLNNGTIANGAFTSSGDQIPGTGAAGGTAQGGQAGYAGTGNPGGSGVTGQGRAVGRVDRRAASASQTYTVNGATSAKAISGTGVLATGAGTFASVTGTGIGDMSLAAVDPAGQTGTVSAQHISANGDYTSGGTGMGAVTPIQQNLAVSLSGNVFALAPDAGGADTSAAAGAADQRSLALKDVAAVPGAAGGGSGNPIDSVSSLSGAGGGGVASIMRAGLGGFAISGLIGADGQAGRFVFDFLRSFNLVSSSGGFGFSDGSRLFTFNDSPNADFLFTTNAGFSDVGGLYDSNYFFDRLNIDRNDHFTRLGDGFFEAQLIASQVREATGQAQLPEFGSALDQAAGLMQSALSAQKKLGLSLGVALTADQVKNLSSSLVWYVKANVSGHDVLVPVVYLAAADKKSISGGALLSGGNVALNVKGDIRNGDVISADKVVSLSAGNDIINSHGGSIRGGTIVASAARDILNQGAIQGGDITLSAGRDISVTAVTSTASSSNRVELGKGRFTSTNSTSTLISGGTIAASGNLALNAGRDLTISSSSVTAGGNAALTAGRDVTLSGANATTVTDAAWKTGKRSYGTSTETHSTFVGSTLTAGGNLSIAAGNTLTVKGSDVAAGGNIGLSAVNGLNIVSAQETASFAVDQRVSKKKTIASAETATTNRLSTITGAGDVTLVSPGAIRIAGAEIAAGGAATIAGGSVSITGVVDTATLDSVTKVKKSGLLSKKVTTTTVSNSDQAVVASAVTGDRVSIASTGNTTILGSNIVSVNGTAIAAGGDVSIGTVAATDSFDKTVKVKKSGISIGGGALFAGVAKASTATTLDTVSNSGSLIGSAKGNVSIAANNALAVTGSKVAAGGDARLAGRDVTIANATDAADATSVSKSSSFGFSLKLYENVSGAVKSAAGLPDRVGANGAGTAGTAITAVSETLRTVSTITKAFTNIAGVSASLGFSKSKTTSASQETAAVGSSITGNTVAIRAAEDLRVKGSAIKAAGDIALAAGRDAIFESAQNTLATQSKSKSSGASIGVSVGVGIVGGVNASASIGVSGSRSSSQSNAVTQVNTEVQAGRTLALVTGRDATLKGAVVEGRDVVASIGRDLSIQSVQDTAGHSSNSAGFSAGVSVSPAPGQSGLGVNGSLSASKATGSSAIVVEQSALLARGGSLNATVTGNTDLAGGVIAALDGTGRDSGKLALATATLSASDIADSARSRDIGIGVSASVNDPFRQGVKGANTPVIDGHYAMSDFRQETKATIGQGQLVVAVPDANVTINRDIGRSQVVTKDKTSGFSLYLDEAAIRETVALLKGDTANSTILQGVGTLAHDPLKPVREVVAEIASLSDSRPNSGALDTLLGKANRLLVGDQRANQDEGRTIASDPRFTGKSAEEIGALRGADAVAQVRALYGDEAATAYAAVLQTPEGQAQLRAVGLITLAYRDKGGDLEAIKDGLIPAELRLEGPSGAVGPGDTTIDGHAPTFGDKTVSVLAGAGKLINKVPPNVQEAASFGTSLLLGGPVAAVGGYFIGKAVEQGIKNSPDAQAAIKEVGLQSVDLLSSSSPDRNREDAEDTGYAESGNLLTAAGTLLNIGTLKKLVSKAGGLIGGAEKAKPTVTVKESGNASLTLSSSEGGYFLEAPQIKVPYGTGIANQGFAFENALEPILGAANRLPPGTKGFDYFDEVAKKATSVKTLDTLTDPKLLNPDSIYASLKGNIDAIIQYEPRAYSRIDIPTSAIDSKELIVGIPQGTTSTQMAAIVRAVDYGELNGIKLKIVITGGQ